jgi:small ligand-binding sensory domain FIST
MQNSFAVVRHWPGDNDESALELWAQKLRGQLASRVSLGLVFMSPRWFRHASRVLELLRVHAQIPLLAGCSGGALISGGQEIEEDPGLVVALFALPRAELKPHRFAPEEIPRGSGPGFWVSRTGVSPEENQGWLVFADPFQMEIEAWLNSWNASYPGRPVLGGLASGRYDERRTQVYLDGEVFESGGVAISFGGGVKLASVISQGCTPIGETWTVTKVEQNLIHQIGNRPAYQVLLETYQQLPAEEQAKARGNLFVGLAMDEYRDEFRRGDFLIRNLVGADRESGGLAIGDLPRAGQTLQFQRRDGRSATDDLTAQLDRAHEDLRRATVYGGCLCSCNGRGRRLFGYPNHDAGMIQARLGPLGLVGFFCNGEIGPVGGRNFLHGYTASLALFVRND